MSAPTKYYALSDYELLRVLEDSRQYSALIEELCQRVEKKAEIDIDDDEQDHQAKVNCPVCEALLEVTDEESHFELKAVHE